MKRYLRSEVVMMMHRSVVLRSSGAKCFPPPTGISSKWLKSFRVACIPESKNQSKVKRVEKGIKSKVVWSLLLKAWHALVLAAFAVIDCARTYGVARHIATTVGARLFFVDE